MLNLMQPFDFLAPDLSSIKHQIRGIDDSYSHEWDILAELCQNSVDAIKLSDRAEGVISLEINAQHESITITDAFLQFQS
jgi:folate-dependent tRNA-U54 methylase TrmFO/GidA